MAYTISVNRGKGWVEVLHRGPLTVTELNDARHQVAELARKESLPHILVDAREADFAGLSVAERFQFSATHQAEFVSVPTVRIAVVVQPQRQPEASFSETVATNRGTRLKVFVDIDEATTWLTTATEE